MFKKRLIILSTLGVLLLAGCNVREKIGDKVLEKVVEKADGVGNVDVDRKDGKVTIEGEDGGKFVFGETQWPDNDLANSVTKFEKGKIVTVMEMPNAVMISFNEVSSDDFGEYLEVIKEEFPNQTYQVNSDGYFNYAAGAKDESRSIILSYSNGDMSLTLTKGE